MADIVMHDGDCTLRISKDPRRMKLRDGAHAVIWLWVSPPQSRRAWKSDKPRPPGMPSTPAELRAIQPGIFLAWPLFELDGVLLLEVASDKARLVGWAFVTDRSRDLQWDPEEETAEVWGQSTVYAEVTMYSEYLQGEVYQCKVTSNEEDMLDEMYGLIGLPYARLRGEEALRNEARAFARRKKRRVLQ